jgi:hypothetical protein
LIGNCIAGLVLLVIGYMAVNQENSIPDPNSSPNFLSPISTPLVPPEVSLNLTPEDLSRLNLTNSDLTEINKRADRVFYQRHPEFQNRSISPEDKNSQLEWHEIRRCVALVDHLFYQRNPETRGKAITKGQPALKAEWLQIRQEVGRCDN